MSLLFSTMFNVMINFWNLCISNWIMSSVIVFSLISLVISLVKSTIHKE